MQRQGPIPGLDGLRAFAVIGVFLSHCGLEKIVPGDLSVTVFFVLSGYLITTLMRKEVAVTGGIAIRSFYQRRLLRLYPPLLIAVALSLLFSVTGLSAVEWSAGGVASVLFYFSNYRIALMGAESGVPVGMGVSWSLAVEEHYYLVYPLAALFILRLGRNWQTGVMALLALGFALWRWPLHYSLGASEMYLKMATDARIDAILFGCLLAVAHNPWLDAGVRRRPKLDLLLLGVCTALILASLLVRDPEFRAVGRNGLRALALTPVIYLVVLYCDHWLTAPLRFAPVVYLGKVSYMFYLVHELFISTLRHSLPQLGPWFNPLVALGLSLLVCELSRRYVENPVARWRERLHRERNRPQADRT